MNPYLWIPALVVLSSAQAWMSLRSSQGHQGWALALWLSALVPVWVLVSRRSTNLLWDVLAYDLTVFFAWGLSTMALVGAWRAYGWPQWLGLGLIGLGFVLFQR